jgi:hypothetical protein
MQSAPFLSAGFGLLERRPTGIQIEYVDIP